MPITAQEKVFEPFPDTLNKSRLYTTIASEALFIGVYHYTAQELWYEDAQTSAFHFNDAFSEYLQMNKVANSFAAYQESYRSYFAYRRAGIVHEKALLYGALTSLIFQTSIEVVDGFYKEYGFSSTDLLNTLIGTSLFVWQQEIFREQFIKIKFSFYPTEYSREVFDNGIESLFKDYDAQTYWVSINANKLFLREKMPDWVNIALGYSTNGLGIQNVYNENESREVIFSLDVDFSKIATKSKVLKFLLRQISFIKLPFPALQWSNDGGFQVKGLYF